MRKMCVFLIFISLIIFFSGESGLMAKQKLNPEKFKKIGVLVVRMGNERAYSPPPDIGEKTDYSLREYSQRKNVYIDDEKRLKDIIPNYPFYPASKINEVILFFQNLSTEMTKRIMIFFSMKGFEPVNVKSMAKEIGLDFSEMTVSQILDTCQVKLDALFILHYMDIGSILIKTKDLDVKNRGFTSVLYSTAIFDVQRRKRMFKYSPLLPISLKGTLIHDSRIMDNPKNKEKIKINCKEELGEIVTEVSYRFNDNELIRYIVDIITHGLKCPKKPFSKCHEYMKCFSIKGVIAWLE